jgi:hypothetical protein
MAAALSLLATIVAPAAAWASTGGTATTITETGFTGATGETFGATSATRHHRRQRHDGHGHWLRPFGRLSGHHLIAVVRARPSGRGGGRHPDPDLRQCQCEFKPTRQPGLTFDSARVSQNFGVGGSCAGYTVVAPDRNTLRLDNLSVPPGGCTVTFSFKGISAGPAAFGLSAFTPDAYPQTPAASTNITVGGLAPTVTALSPATGPLAGGTAVTLTGTDFTGATAVTFGTTAATAFTVDSETQITATAPAGTGTVDVTVTTAIGTSATAGTGNDYTYAAPLQAIGASLSFAPLGVGADGVFTITLTNPNPTNSPAFDIFSATDAALTSLVAGAAGGTCSLGSTSAISPRSVFYRSVIVPPGSCTLMTSYTGVSEGIATFSIDPFQPSGYPQTPTASVSFQVSVPPTVTSVFPFAGPTTGGTSVTIDGTNFTGATGVSFGTTPATAFTVNSATSITATAPAGAGTVDVRVTKAGVTSAAAGPGNDYTYAPEPWSPACRPPPDRRPAARW